MEVATINAYINSWTGSDSVKITCQKQTSRPVYNIPMYIREMYEFTFCYSLQPDSVFFLGLEYGRIW